MRRRLKHAVDATALALLLHSASALAGDLWISPAEIAALPRTGPAWDALLREASATLGAPDLADQDSRANVRLLAKALVSVRTDDAGLRDEVLAALDAVRGTERGASALAVCRELTGYLLAADIVGLDPPRRAAFSRWLRELRSSRFDGQTIAEIHERRPNNWGTHAGASRIAMALYLGDLRELTRAIDVFRGWLGEPGAYTGFRFGSPDWQPEHGPVFGINPVGTTRHGRSLDGVLPDDQRRAGRFRWPPPRENYVYEALQGAITQAQLLDRAGFDAWAWGERALLRAFEWLYDIADFPAAGDDSWQPHLINWAYCTHFPVSVPARPGKAVGYTDWTLAAGGCRDGR
jgi:hypothetical protein